MINWLKKSAAILIHDRQIAEHGGSRGLRAESLLDSALARPQQLYAYGDPPPDLASLAAALAFGLARNHPFVDGNKRVAAVACEAFIHMNGARLEASDPELFVQYFNLAAGTLSEQELADWLRPRLQNEPVGGVHEPRTKYGRRQAPARRGRTKTAQRKPRKAAR